MGLQLRRGTDSDRLLITPASGEPLFTTDTKKFYIGDGVTAGGILLADGETIDSSGQSIFATITYVNNAIDSVVGGAPNSLDTLQELAAAINNDSDFYNSLRNLIDGQLDSAEVINIIDSSYVNARLDTTLFLDSAAALTLIDSAIVQSRFKTLQESDGKLIVSGDILPDADSVYSIGRADRKFKDLFLSGGTIYIDNLALEADPSTNTLSLSILDSGQLTKLGVIATVDSSQVGEIVDSAFVQRRVDENYLSGIIDSAYVLDRSTNYIQQQIDALVDAAPGALDTLNELAAAINDDSAFSVTITNSIATKLAINDFETYFDSNLGKSASTDTIRSYFSAGGDLSYDSTTGKFEFDIESVYTKANFDSDLNLALATNAVTTTDLSEGDNQYYTRNRFDSAFNERVAAFDQNLIPDSNEHRSIGTPTKRFKDLWLAGNTLILGELSISAGEGGSLDIAQVDSTGEVVAQTGNVSSKNLDNVFDISLDSTGQQTIDAFSKNRFRTARYVIQMSHDSSPSYHSTEILLMHNDTNVFMTEYAVLKTQDSDVGEITATMQDSSVKLLITPNYNNITVKAKRLIIDV